MKIVIADQDLHNLGHLNEVFGEQDSQIWTANTGQEARQLIEEYDPDVVLLEPMLLNEDGLWVLENLPSTYDFRKIIVLSNYNSQLLTKNIMKYGVSYFLLKPISIEVLKKRIESVYNYNNSIEEEMFVGDNGVQSIICRTETNVTRQLDDSTLEKVVFEVLQMFGIRTQLKGFDFLKFAIKESLTDATLLKNMTTKLYPEVAQKNETTPSRVERAMRHAIETGWVETKDSAKRSFFGDAHSGMNAGVKPTNAAFISAVVAKLKAEYKVSL